jgi:hypothetical protein
LSTCKLQNRLIQLEIRRARNSKATKFQQFIQDNTRKKMLSDMLLEIGRENLVEYFTICNMMLKSTNRKL